MPRLASEAVAESFAATTARLREGGLLSPTLTLERLGAELDDAQREVVERVLSLDPKDFGVNIPYVGLEPVPQDLAVISGQQYRYLGELKTIEDTYLPRPVHDAFVRMSDGFRTSYPQRALLIES